MNLNINLHNKIQQKNGHENLIFMKCITLDY